MLISSQLKLSLRLKTHILDLSHILSVFLVNIFYFVFSIIHDLLDDLSVILLHPFNFSSQLLSLGDLPFHQGSMLLHDGSNIPIVLIDKIVDIFFMLSAVFFFLSLEFLELSGIFKHFLGILISFLFQFYLELLCQLFNTLFKSILHFSFVFMKGIVLVLFLNLVIGKFFLKLEDLIF